jgi:rRNA maturation RNase YbeY
MSVDRIKENAKAFKVPYQNELLRVMIHGALHLCGYTDHNKTEKQNMRSKENHYLNKFPFHVKQILSLILLITNSNRI